MNDGKFFKIFCFKSSTRRFCGLGLLLVCFFLQVLPASAKSWSPQAELLEPGMELAVIPFITELNSSEELAVLRLDPQEATLDLLMSSELGIAPLTPEDWAKKYDLAAVINASMYLGNATTSTGYMRHGSFVNNGKIAARFGAFFVAGLNSAKSGKPPGKSELRRSAILDRDADDWESLLPLYESVAQNFRIIDDSGQVLWGDGDKRHSIAALGEDEDGFLYFIHTPGFVTVPEFVRALSVLSVRFTRLMYVEGGHPAALHIRTQKLTRTWLGRSANFLQENPASSPLPNVIVVRSKADSK